MTVEVEKPQEDAPRTDALGGLQQALQRLTSPQVEPIHTDLSEVKERLDALQIALGALEQRYADTSSSLKGELSSLLPLLKAAQSDLSALEAALSDPDQVAERMRPVLVQAIANRVQEEQDSFAEAVAPVMGLAIRNQIRTARDDIVEALYPIIGQIISKSISEAIRELSRNIDRRLRRRLDIRSRWETFVARLQGISEAELMMRNALDYSVKHIFLIHRNSGLLLHHLSAYDNWNDEFDTMSGMLTAIRDFVRDSFGQGEGDLEEIAHGSQRILLASGRGAYVAVVLDGVEPTGYASLMDRVASEINLEHEALFRDFEGEMRSLPDFTAPLSVLLRPSPEQLDFEDTDQLTPAQKRLIAIAIGGVVVALAAAVFACIFTIRLWPYAFGAAAAAPLPTAEIILPPPTFTDVPASTATASPTPVPTFTLTPEPTATPSAVPSATLPPTATITPAPAEPTGLLTGNVNLREAPSADSASFGVIPAGESVIILGQEGDWYLVRWAPPSGDAIEGWIWGRFLEVNP